MKQIHDQLVVTPTANVNDSVAFTCKLFYIEVLLKKLGISRNEQAQCPETSKCYGLG